MACLVFLINVRKMKGKASYDHPAQISVAVPYSSE